MKISSIKVVGISVDKRTKSAPKVQEILTKFGDNIISRYGVHDVGEHEKGLITLNFVGGNESLSQLKSELNDLEGVIVKSVDLE